jgi:hypothetical protein
MASKPIRLTKGKVAVELSAFIFVMIYLSRAFTWFFRRFKPVAYHPLAWPGIALVGWALWVNPLLCGWLLLAGFLVAFAWWLWLPDSFRRLARPRVLGFLAGWKYRHRPRKKLAACALLEKDEPIQTIPRVRAFGCTHEVLVKMNYGEDMELWRSRATRLAQTYGALDCKVNPYRRIKFTSFRSDALTLKPPFVHFDKVTRQQPLGNHSFEEQVTKPRIVKLEFLARDPFSKPIGIDYLHYWQSAFLFEEGNPVGCLRSGMPYVLKTDTHLLVVAMSQRGKSTAERTMVYADREYVQQGLVENWGVDLKRGVEIKFMESQFARVEYGLDGPQAVALFWREAKAVMNRRLDAIREDGGDVRHVPRAGHWDGDTWVPGDPKLNIYVDEFLAFEDEEYNQVRGEIYRDINAIQRRGAAADVHIRAFAQDPKKEKFPNRDGFPEVHVGGVLNRTQVDMIMPGGWDAGAHAEDIPKDLPGLFFARGDGLQAPVDFRYARIPNAEIKRLKACPGYLVGDTWVPISAFTQTPEEEKQEMQARVLIA